MGGLKFYDTGCGSVFAIVLSVLISSTRSVTFLSISCFWNKVVPIAPLRYCFPSVEMLISVPWNIVPAISTASGLQTMSVFDPFGK